jgi:hypothetical protein
MNGRRSAVDLPRLWAIAALAGVFVVANLAVVHPNDFWWHVAAGELITGIGRVPTVDLFSYTQFGQPFAYQSWLMEVALYLLMQIGDLPLVIFSHAAALTAAYALLLWTCRRAAGGTTHQADGLRAAAAATLAAAVAGVTNWNVRPQTISFPLFALTLFIVRTCTTGASGGETPRKRRWALWLLVPVFVLWANAHGGFVLGLALIGAALLGRIVQWLRGEIDFPAHLTLATLGCAFATVLTPLGVSIVDYVLGFVRHPITRTLNIEFMPATIVTLSGQLFFGFVAIWILALYVGRYLPRPPEAAALLVFGALALISRRNIVWFAMVAAPSLAAALGQWSTTRPGGAHPTERRRRGLNLALVAALVVLALLSLPWLRPYLPMVSADRVYVMNGTPVAAVAALRALAPQPRRVFHSAGHGSYMIWASPRTPVFIDTRVELYPPDQWHDYVALSTARYDWQEILDHYEVDALLLQRGIQDDLIRAALESPLWDQAYSDAGSALFRRAGSS